MYSSLCSNTRIMEPKKILYQQLARMAKALSAPARVEILDVLAQGPHTVERLAERTSQSVANASQHLKVLRSTRLVDATRKGTFIEYRLAHPDMAGMLVSLREAAERHLLELQAARHELTRASDVERIGRRELLQRMRDGEVILIDVRPPNEYAAAHLPGALSIPLNELSRHLRELPKSREVVAYCRGPYCMLAVEAVQQIRRHGRRARHLPDGVLEWRSAGLRVEEGDQTASR
jgi:rhodanese-related sulfurtransferase/DNA-binding transcriptional ArsR family regulator